MSAWSGGASAVLFIDPPRALGRLAVMLALALGCGIGIAQPIDAHVEMHGGAVVVDVQATAAVEPAQALAVLTDYDHMAEFLSMLKSSAIVGHSGNLLQVEQIGEAKVAFMRFTFRSLRSVEVVAGREIRSHLISGDFKSYEFTTRIASFGGQTLITHHGEYVPDAWIPPGIGASMVQAQTIKQYQELIAEMLRRKHGAAGVGSSAHGVAAVR